MTVKERFTHGLRPTPPIQTRTQNGNHAVVVNVLCCWVGSLCWSVPSTDVEPAQHFPSLSLHSHAIHTTPQDDKCTSHHGVYQKNWSHCCWSYSYCHCVCVCVPVFHRCIVRGIAMASTPSPGKPIHARVYETLLEITLGRAKT